MINMEDTEQVNKTKTQHLLEYDRTKLTTSVVNMYSVYGMGIKTYIQQVNINRDGMLHRR